MNAQEVFCQNIRNTIFLILIVFFTSIAGQAADPDFSGTWRSNPSQSTVQRAPLPPGKLLNIQHRGITVTCEALTEASTVENRSFTTDRKESRHESDGATRSTVAKWEGDNILVNTIVLMRSGAQYIQVGALDTLPRSKYAPNPAADHQFARQLRVPDHSTV
ncbi:MAG TPA: hypothetical protein VFQ79_22905 [Bryobacteraceae bacterium]|nr:hypothetical protein [Bryobacteraceae bacterium]